MYGGPNGDRWLGPGGLWWFAVDMSLAVIGALVGVGLLLWFGPT
jgi:uncharacterized membrane protein YjdF